MSKNNTLIPSNKFNSLNHIKLNNYIYTTKGGLYSSLSSTLTIKDSIHHPAAAVAAVALTAAHNQVAADSNHWL